MKHELQISTTVKIGGHSYQIQARGEAERDEENELKRLTLETVRSVAMAIQDIVMLSETSHLEPEEKNANVEDLF